MAARNERTRNRPTTTGVPTGPGGTSARAISIRFAGRLVHTIVHTRPNRIPRRAAVGNEKALMIEVIAYSAAISPAPIPCAVLNQ
jgi:hypothetical protein